MAVSKTARQRVRAAARLFALLSGETRVAILQLLSKRKELQVGEIAEELGMTHSAVSHQLSLLSEHGIVVARKDGRTVSYSITKAPNARLLVRSLQSLL